MTLLWAQIPLSDPLSFITKETENGMGKYYEVAREHKLPMSMIWTVSLRGAYYEVEIGLMSLDQPLLSQQEVQVLTLHNFDHHY